MCTKYHKISCVPYNKKYHVYKKHTDTGLYVDTCIGSKLIHNPTNNIHHSQQQRFSFLKFYPLYTSQYE